MTPQDIAVVRAMLAAGRAAGCKSEHEALRGVAYERNWRIRRGGHSMRVVLDRHGLRVIEYRNYASATLVSCGEPTSVQQVADLLYAVGLVPVELTSGWLAAQVLGGGA